MQARAAAARAREADKAIEGAGGMHEASAPARRVRNRRGPRRFPIATHEAWRPFQ